MFNEKTILVTGGTGSFGKKFIQTILANYNPKKVIVYSRDELKQFEMQNDQFFCKYIGGDNDILRYFIGDIRDLERLKMAMNGVDIVVHAAALKQVPATEYNPFEAVKTNILGGQNIIDAAFKNSVKKVIALSTDKAAYPINAMGMTKALMEKVMVSNSRNLHSKTIFCGTRYGNVMASRGSVIPLFIQQIKENKPLLMNSQITTMQSSLHQL